MILADLAAIKARCEAATPGPWEVNGSPHDRRIAEVGRHVITKPGRDGRSARNETVADFIAHAREDVPALLEAVERLLSMLTDAQTEAEMQAAEVARLSAESDRLHFALHMAAVDLTDSDEAWRNQ
jgi:hypothetical protein